jgi:hypothetical protein
MTIAQFKFSCSHTRSTIYRSLNSVFILGSSYTERVEVIDSVLNHIKKSNCLAQFLVLSKRQRRHA